MKIIKNYIEKVNNLKKWQKRKLFSWFFMIILLGITYLGTTGYVLYHDKIAEDFYWENGLKDNAENLNAVASLSQNAIPVTAGTYIENIKSIDIKDDNFRVLFNCWFRWEGNKELDMLNNFRIYNGTINNIDILDDFVKDGVHYQSARIDTTISKSYWTNRFPLESYQLRIYIESLYPAEQVNLIADTEYSSISPNLAISNFTLRRHAVSTYTMKYDNDKNDPVKRSLFHQELVTSLEINRDGFGLYIKCFIALLGTLTWVFITMFICTYHRVDPLGMIPGALFGTVANIMVGANLLPDALKLGLLEFVNLAGVAIIILSAMAIININRIRTKHQNNGFAYLYGRMMFYTLLTFTIIGIFWFPLMAYKF